MTLLQDLVAWITEGLQEFRGRFPDLQTNFGWTANENTTEL